MTLEQAVSRLPEQQLENLVTAYEKGEEFRRFDPMKCAVAHLTD